MIKISKFNYKGVKIMNKEKDGFIYPKEETDKNTLQLRWIPVRWEERG